MSAKCSDIDRVLGDIRHERHQQDAKWGEQNHTPEMWLAILTEEVGFAKEIAESRLNPFAAGFYRTELIQLAAVAVSAVQALDRLKQVQADDRLAWLSEHAGEVPPGSSRKPGS